MNTHTHAYITHIYIDIHMCTYTHIYTYVGINTDKTICEYIHMHICTHIYSDIHAHIYTYTHQYTYFTLASKIRSFEDLVTIVTTE